jgi:hypothetical protein
MNNSGQKGASRATANMKKKCQVSGRKIKLNKKIAGRYVYAKY